MSCIERGRRARVNIKEQGFNKEDTHVETSVKFTIERKRKGCFKRGVESIGNTGTDIGQRK